MQMAKIGAADKGGVCRLVLTRGAAGSNLDFGLGLSGIDAFVACRNFSANMLAC